jgi:hypothetical protein
MINNKTQQDYKYYLISIDLNNFIIMKIKLFIFPYFYITFLQITNIFIIFYIIQII